ncbi:MAG: hypothetical protein RQ752_12455, partial [Thermohalobaculum sp.]|nr:hypothetical protein [Thermohalobaculum sp.]
MTAPRAIAYPPVEVALHDWWAGIYGHVFVALHPLHAVAVDGAGEDDLDAIKAARPVTWEALRRAVGAPPFAGFALALWCATLSARRADADARLVDRIERTLAENRLCAPWEDTVPPILERPLGEAFARLGVAEVIAWDEGRAASVPLSPAELAAPPAIARRLEAKPEEGGLGLESIRVRSPLTCESRLGVCGRCYGADLSTGRLVEEGL